NTRAKVAIHLSSIRSASIPKPPCPALAPRIHPGKLYESSYNGRRVQPGPEAMPRFVDDYLSYLLARASHQVSRAFHAQLKPYGLSVPQWRVLATLVK